MLLALFGVVGLVVLGEAIWFYHVISKNEPLHPSDLIVVFAGTTERIRTGYELARLGHAPRLLISPADGKQLETYDKKYGVERASGRIIENKARTTLENAAYTSRIIKKNGFDSVILVTSHYHMPRSYFLLRTLLAGSSVEIQTYGVPKGGQGLENVCGSLKVKRRVYNEMIEIWASSLELIMYRFNGGLPEKALNQSAPIKWLKSKVLFRV